MDTGVGGGSFLFNFSYPFWFLFAICLMGLPLLAKKRHNILFTIWISMIAYTYYFLLHQQQVDSHTLTYSVLVCCDLHSNNSGLVE